MFKVFIIFIIFLVGLYVFETMQRYDDIDHKKLLVDNYINPHLSNNDKVIDIGSGSGTISKLTGAQPVDVVDLSTTGTKPVIFDGKHIPFEDDSYDVSLCISVLHHTSNQNDIIKELKRISNKIIIFEDIPDTPIDRLLCTLHSLSSYGKCYSCFHTTQEWIDIFHSHGLTVEHIVEVPRSYSVFYPVKRNFFILTHRGSNKPPKKIIS